LVEQETLDLNRLRFRHNLFRFSAYNSKEVKDEQETRAKTALRN